MRNYKLTLQYDGTDFSGWQVQPGRRTVQEVVEAAMTSITQETCRLNASGRTDAGVHALGQVANVYLRTRLAVPTLLKGINALLPPDVRLREIHEVPQSFCANKDALTKRYRYVIGDSPRPDPFQRRYAWLTHRPLNESAMHRAAQTLLGRHDFLAFETEGPNRLSSVRTIKDITIQRYGEYIAIEIEADGFLYNMVRAIVGTLYQIGRGYWQEERMAAILHSRDRTQAGPTAPPQGLFLLSVSYPPELECREPPEASTAEADPTRLAFPFTAKATSSPVMLIPISAP